MFSYLNRPTYRVIGAQWALLLLGLIFSLTFSLTASAQSAFKYNYVEVAYLIGEFEFVDSEVDTKGYEITAQFELSPSFVLGGSYRSLEGDESELTTAGPRTLNFDASGPSVYSYYHSPVGVQSDFILGALLDMSELEAGVQGEALTLNQNDDTSILFTGLRHRLSGLEIRAQWFYNLDAEDNEDQWSYKIDVLSGEPTGLQLGFQITPDNEGDVLGVSIRQSY
ncbi:MAG: hypothetical protein KTR32_17680 [Granulosicoccus sp.]|nr:hypothetical protein [Granulosicoccus sp.]